MTTHVPVTDVLQVCMGDLAPLVMYLVVMTVFVVDANQYDFAA